MASAASTSTHQLIIEYPDELLWALEQNEAQFEQQARTLLAVKLYESGKLTTGLAAQLAGMPRSAFFYTLSQHGLSPFGTDPDDLADDLANAAAASHSQ